LRAAGDQTDREAVVDRSGRGAVRHHGRPTFRLPGHDGVGIDAGVVASWLTRERDGLRSSMLEDRLAGRPLELDANPPGSILRALGVSGAPITAAAVQEILTLRDARSSLAPGGNAHLGKVVAAGR
jgi:hypothetical protein